MIFPQPFALPLAAKKGFPMLPGLTAGELEALLSELNRFRYSLEEEPGFIRFYLAVHEALANYRKNASVAYGSYAA